MPQIDPQLMRGLMGGTFVPGIDPQQEEENWLNLQAKRLALQRQPRLQDLQEQNIQSEIANRSADNQRANEIQQAGILAAAASRKKEEDALATKLKTEAETKDRDRHGRGAIELFLDPSDAKIDALVRNSVLNGDEGEAFRAIPVENRKAEARGLMAQNMDRAAIEAFDKEQSTIASQAATADKSRADIKKIEAETVDATAKKAQADEAYGLWADQNKLPRNALTRLQFERMPKETTPSAPNNEAEYAFAIAQGKAPNATPEQKAAGQVAQVAFDILQKKPNARGTTGTGTGGDGKDMTQGALDHVSKLREGLTKLDGLGTLIDEQAGYMGKVVGQLGKTDREGLGSSVGNTIAGIAQTLGYDGPAKFNAQLKLIKQSIGKAMEGGVLRKEDEAKYEQILPSITDTPSIAKHKVALVKETLENDIQTYLQTQQQGGRKTKGMEGAPSPAKPEAGTPKVGDSFGGGTIKSVRKVR